MFSKGFEIETEMTIHAVNYNMQVENVVVEYRDRPEGSQSKLNTYSDGLRVIRKMLQLYRNYRPARFFGAACSWWRLGRCSFCPFSGNTLPRGWCPGSPR